MKLTQKTRRLTEKKSDYETAHKSYTSAVQAAEDFAIKNGYEVDKEQMARDIGMGTQRPKKGKTTRFTIDLYKNGKPQRKKLHAQVYGQDHGIDHSPNQYVYKLGV